VEVPDMKVLVTVASKHGATMEIADWIGDAVEQAGLEADVIMPDDVFRLDPYAAVILGSSVYAGKWNKDAKALVDRLSSALRARPVWLFSSGPVGDPLKPTEDPADIDAIVTATNAREHRLFPGRIDREGLGFGERAVVTALRVPAGDYRDREEVESWVQEIVAALKVPATA
jgi:menaquinone-dependent protoporphyrinogen oxidase